ncbi:sugar phosphate isomerase/epimerase [Marine Group I thaumarchaeote]|uniref:Sugar phosphate isomerase/epimerase n=1 Tax=Marine Group I thaumarchaeote TaxID=2511932 RepID=A0A7K4MNU0_9ARCH|nr:sugar phosphate isomerase/epimerase [Marine Group I thaumarchaeote]
MPSNLNIGIMQGRLSPKINDKIQAFPKKYWKEEFKIASECNFDSIEWIIDEFENPIMNKTEIHKIEKISSEFDVKINSLCCDFFMDNLLFKISDEQQRENVTVLKKLIEHAHVLGIKILEIPLVDSSSMKNEEEEKQLVTNLNKIIQYAEDLGIIIGLETDYSAQKIIKLLENFESENIALNYDTGNSASLGFNPKEELTTLGKYIKNIHIKDRKLHGNTVPFGEGDVDFDLFFSTLRDVNYNGDLILQGARIENEIPKEVCIKYRDFVTKYIERYF